MYNVHTSETLFSKNVLNFGLAISANFSTVGTKYITDQISALKCRMNLNNDHQISENIFIISMIKHSMYFSQMCLKAFFLSICFSTNMTGCTIIAGFFFSMDSCNMFLQSILVH